jgi:Spy/CpxP family protein refolding chaperone
MTFGKATGMKQRLQYRQGAHIQRARNQSKKRKEFLMRASAKSLTISIILWLVAASANWGQLPPPILGKWWNNPRIIQDLGLSPQQIQKLESIFLENRKLLIDLRAEHDKQQIDLDALISRPISDEGIIRAKVDQLYKAKAEVEKVTLLMRIRSRDVLTTEQQVRFKDLFEQYVQDQQDRRKKIEGKAPVNRVPPKRPPGVIPPTNPPKKPV